MSSRGDTVSEPGYAHREIAESSADMTYLLPVAHVAVSQTLLRW
jgi:hypothetical protein